MKEISGVIPVFKNAGMTSHDVVAILRKKLGIKKIGHSGTLDPMVTGVLPVLIGKATRLSDFFMNVPKKYHAIGMLGVATDTEDAHGTVISQGDPAHFTESDIRFALDSFLGEITQIPPDYSAVKVGGKKLIDYAHHGEVLPEKRERTVTVHDIRLCGYQNFEFEFDITCSKGTYVRTICADVGKKLGIPAHMKELTRTESGGFRLSEAIPLEECTADSIIPMSQAARRIFNIPRWVLPPHPNTLKRLENGIRFDIRAFAIRLELPCDSCGAGEDVGIANDGGTDTQGGGAGAAETRADNVRMISDRNQLRHFSNVGRTHSFVYVEDCFYGIANANFELEKLIKDN